MGFFVSFSNLKRAKATAKNIFVTNFDDAEEVPLLQEATKYEHVFASTLRTRITEFEQWLSKIEESTIVIVGHAQYFKHMINFSTNIHNCDVWKMDCTFRHSAEGAVSVKWGCPALEFRSTYSYTHPMNRFSMFYNDTTQITPAFLSTDPSIGYKNGRGHDSQSDVGTEEEVICRICHVSAGESEPSDVFIRPCKCSGTIRHVHISCLNEWRATSASAAYKCSICHYTYRIERTTLSNFLMSEKGTQMISVLLITFATFALGIGGVNFMERVFSIDICWEICKLTQWPMWWRNCSFYRLSPFLYKSFSFFTEIMFRKDVESIRAIILCHEITVWIAEVSLVGCALMGVVGMSFFIVNEVYTVYYTVNRGDCDWLSMAVFGIWLVSLGGADMGRISIWLGFAISCRSLYYNIRKVGKKIAQKIGENILEPY